MDGERITLRVQQTLHYEVDLEVGKDIEAADAASLKLMDGKYSVHMTSKEESILGQCLKNSTPYLSEYDEIEVTEN